MKKLLIIGAGVEQVPAIKIAQEMGHFVITTDMLPSAPGMKIADESYTVSTNDYQGNLEVAEKENIDGLMTLCSEIAVPVVAKVAGKLQLPGISEYTALAATNKGTMREAMESYGIAMSDYKIIETPEDAVEFAKKYDPPWVLKPSDCSGQRGTTFTSDLKEVAKAFEFAQKYAGDKKVLIDEFVLGPEINITALANKGQIKILSLSNRVTLAAPNFGIAVRHIAPTHLDEKGIEAIKDMAVKSIRAIQLENGIAYPQIIMSKDGPRFMEIAARIPGGHMREAGMYLSGIDMIKTSILQAVGVDFKFEDVVTEEFYPSISIQFITHPNIDKRVGIVEEIGGLEEVSKMEGVKLCYVRLEKGKPVPNLESSVGRFGAIITVGENKWDTIKKTTEAFNKITINGYRLIEYNNYNPANHHIISNL